MSTYLLIPHIKGNVQEKSHNDWIAINTITFTINRHISTLPGQVYDRELSHPNISELIITKTIDNSSVLLFQNACTAKAIDTAIIDLCQTNHSGNAYAQITLKNIIITHYSLISDTTPQQRPLESIQINFDYIEFRYTPYSKDNQALSPITAGYGLRQAKTI